MTFIFFFFKDTATTEIYTYCPTLSLPGALPICGGRCRRSSSTVRISAVRTILPRPSVPGGSIRCSADEARAAPDDERDRARGQRRHDRRRDRAREIGREQV